MRYLQDYQIEFPHFIDPTAYEDGQAQKLADDLLNTIPFLQDPNFTVDESYLHSQFQETIWVGRLRQLKTDLLEFSRQFLSKQTEEKAKKEVLKKLSQTIAGLKTYAANLMEYRIKEMGYSDSFIQNKDMFVKFGLSTIEQEEIIALYTEKKVNEMTWETTRKHNLLRQDEDTPTHDLLHELEIELGPITVLETLWQKFLYKPKDKPPGKEELQADQNLKGKISDEFVQFCLYLSSSQNIKLHFQHEGLKKAFSAFLEKTITFKYADQKTVTKTIYQLIKENQLREKQLNLLDAMINKRQYCLDHLQPSPNMRSYLEESINSIKLEKEKRLKSFTETEQLIQAEKAKLLNAVIDDPRKKKSDEIAKRFNLKIENIEQGNFSAFLAQVTAPGWSDMWKNAFSYMPSLNTIKAGGLGAGVGMVMGGPLAAFLGMAAGAAAGSTATSVASTFSSAIPDLTSGAEIAWYGEMTTKYKGYDVTPALLAVCNNNNETAFVLNSFYVRYLFDFDLILRSMTEAEKNSPEGKGLKSLRDQFHTKYMALRDGKVGRENVMAHVGADIQLLLQGSYHKNAKATAKFISAMQSLFNAKQEQLLLTAPEKRSVALLGFKQDKSPQPALKEQQAVIPATMALAVSAPPGALTEVDEQSETRLQKLEENISELIIERDKTKENMLGLDEELETLRMFAEYMDISFVQGKVVKMDEKKQKALTKMPLAYTLDDLVKKLVNHNSPEHLLYWFEENLFKPGASNWGNRVNELNTPLPSFDGKSLWHILCEQPQGEWVFNVINKLQTGESTDKSIKPDPSWASRLSKGVMSLAAQTTKGAWSLFHYFNPTLTYNGLNPIQYAAKVGNVPLLKAFVQGMVSDNKWSDDDIKKIFPEVGRDPNAAIFADALKVASHKPAKARTVPQLSTIELTGALAVCIASGNPIPTEQADIEKFLKSLKHTAIGNYSDAELTTLAKNMSKFVKDRSVLLNFSKNAKDLIKDMAIQMAAGIVVESSRWTAHMWTTERSLREEEQAMIVAVLKGDTKEVEKMMNNGALAYFARNPIKVSGSVPINLLYLAARLGHEEIAGILYKNAQIFSDYVRKSGPDEAKPEMPISALVLAAKHGHTKVVRKLLELGGKTWFAQDYERKAIDSQGKTTLHYLASKIQYADTCLVLIATEKNLKKLQDFANVSDQDGNTPLHLMNYKGSERTITMIQENLKENKLKFGEVFAQSLTAKNKDNQTPLSLALRKNQLATAKILFNEMVAANLIEQVEREIAGPMAKHISHLLEESIQEGKHAKDQHRFAKQLVAYARLSILTGNENAFQAVVQQLDQVFPLDPSAYSAANEIIAKFALQNIKSKEAQNFVVDRVVKLASSAPPQLSQLAVRDILKELDNNPDKTLLIFLGQKLEEKNSLPVEMRKILPESEGVKALVEEFTPIAVDEPDSDVDESSDSELDQTIEVKKSKPTIVEIIDDDSEQSKPSESPRTESPRRRDFSPQRQQQIKRDSKEDSPSSKFPVRNKPNS